MSRLTKHIALVLISSSLVLHGCEQPTRSEKLDPEQQSDGVGDFSESEEQDAPGTSGTSGNSGSHTTSQHHSGWHGTHFIPVPIPGRSFGSGSRPGGSSFSSGSSSRGGNSSSRSGGSSFSSGSSSRGGFGHSSFGGGS